MPRARPHVSRISRRIGGGSAADNGRLIKCLKRGKRAKATRRYPIRIEYLKQISEGILGMANPVYPSDVKDAEWELLAPLIPTSKLHGRPQSSDMRRITN